MQNSKNYQMIEQKFDEKLRISTIGRDDENADCYRFPYEPTPYSVLERLVENNYLTENSVVIDYGCGKGRVGFFLREKVGCECIGIEYDEKIYNQAIKNLQSFNRDKVSFVNARAEVYPVENADNFYFFNPFSAEILQAVLRQILDSYYENPRKMQLFFYFPSDEYLGILMTTFELDFVDEIDCSDLFSENLQRERILIFKIDI